MKAMDFQEPEVAVVEMPAAYHPGDVEVLQRLLSEPLDRGCARIVLDVTSAEFVCSTAIGCMVYNLKRAQDEGGDLRLVSGGLIARVLDTCDLGTVFRSFDSVEDAVRSFEAD